MDKIDALYQVSIIEYQEHRSDISQEVQQKLELIILCINQPQRQLLQINPNHFPALDSDETQALISLPDLALKKIFCTTLKSLELSLKQQTIEGVLSVKGDFLGLWKPKNISLDIKNGLLNIPRSESKEGYTSLDLSLYAITWLGESKGLKSQYAFKFDTISQKVFSHYKTITFGSDDIKYSKQWYGYFKMAYDHISKKNVPDQVIVTERRLSLNKSNQLSQRSSIEKTDVTPQSSQYISQDMSQTFSIIQEEDQKTQDESPNLKQIMISDQLAISQIIEEDSKGDSEYIDSQQQQESMKYLDTKQQPQNFQSISQEISQYQSQELQSTRLSSEQNQNKLQEIQEKQFHELQQQQELKEQKQQKYQQEIQQQQSQELLQQQNPTDIQQQQQQSKEVIGSQNQPNDIIPIQVHASDKNADKISESNRTTNDQLKQLKDEVHLRSDVEYQNEQCIDSLQEIEIIVKQPIVPQEQHIQQGQLQKVKVDCIIFPNQLNLWCKEGDLSVANMMCIDGYQIIQQNGCQHLYKYLNKKNNWKSIMTITNTKSLVDVIEFIYNREVGWNIDYKHPISSKVEQKDENYCKIIDTFQGPNTTKRERFLYEQREYILQSSDTGCKIIHCAFQQNNNIILVSQMENKCLMQQIEQLYHLEYLIEFNEIIQNLLK